MTDIEEKALALLNEVRSEYPFAADYHAIGIALNRAIEQHEAFKQKVSDEVVCYFSGADLDTRLHRFIIPKPKPDPLVEVMKQAGWADAVIDSCAPSLSAALEARGLEIREKGQ